MPEPQNPGSRSFLWGAATAAYQIEGGYDADGKGAGIWDEFCAVRENTRHGHTGNRACDHYRLWKRDIELMRELNLNSYRLSISWPRVMPTGRETVNEPGLGFYDLLIDGLLSAGITPFVTLYHWDLPAALQNELGGWTHPEMAGLFADYAGVVFDRLGDRVKHWLTLNEPWVVVLAGYIDGVHAPGIKDRRLGYRAGHNLMRAHALAAARYRASRHGDGKIGFALNSSYSFPASETPEDCAAAQRAIENFAGWFGDPAHFGDYPTVMRERLGDLLPEFTAEERRLLRKSQDFIAINYYMSEVVRYKAGAGPMELELVPQSTIPKTEMGWPIMPDGFTELLCWLSRRYGALPVYVTENGAAFDDQPDESGNVEDQNRINYLRDHVAAMHAAQARGVDVRGYFVWSLMDNLEWTEGFSKRFGLIRCDFETLKRTIKASGRWYARMIEEAGRMNSAGR